VEEPKALLEAIRSTRFHYTSEDDLQRGLAALLDQLGVQYEREFHLDAQSRIDFLVEGGLGVEMKIDGPVSELGYQILRYLQHDAVKAMLVVTTRSSHRDLPPALEGKPVWVVYLFTSAF